MWKGKYGKIKTGKTNGVYNPRQQKGLVTFRCRVGRVIQKKILHVRSQRRREVGWAETTKGQKNHTLAAGRLTSTSGEGAKNREGSKICLKTLPKSPPKPEVKGRDSVRTRNAGFKLHGWEGTLHPDKEFRHTQFRSYLGYSFR